MQICKKPTNIVIVFYKKNGDFLSQKLNWFLNIVIVFYTVEKRFYSVENLVEKPVGEQDKTHEYDNVSKGNVFQRFNV